MNTTNVLMLQAFGSTTDVADYRVVQPAAKLNLLVMTSFSLLFTPQAARFFARGDKAGINNLYWRTAAWTAVFSFPVFAMTCMSSHAVTVGAVRRALRQLGADPRAAQPRLLLQRRARATTA